MRPEAFSDEFLRVAVADDLAHPVGPEQPDELLDRGIGAQRGAPLVDEVEHHVVALRVRDREREAVADAAARIDEGDVRHAGPRRPCVDPGSMQASTISRERKLSMSVRNSAPYSARAAAGSAA